MNFYEQTKHDIEEILEDHNISIEYYERGIKLYENKIISLNDEIYDINKNINNAIKDINTKKILDPYLSYCTKKIKKIQDNIKLVNSILDNYKYIYNILLNKITQIKEFNVVFNYENKNDIQNNFDKIITKEKYSYYLSYLKDIKSVYYFLNLRDYNDILFDPFYEKHFEDNWMS